MRDAFPFTIKARLQSSDVVMEVDLTLGVGDGSAILGSWLTFVTCTLLVSDSIKSL